MPGLNPLRPSRRLFLGSAAVLAFASAADAARRTVRRDPRIEQLIARMTLEEKAGQLSIYTSDGAGRLVGPSARPDAGRQAMVDEVVRGAASGYFDGDDPAFWRTLQTAAVERSRLRIPLIFAGDVVYGLKTIFPLPLGEAAAFDPELCRRTARAAAVEATARGFHWTFAPMVDVARDQRWGRVAEGAGEDPWLGSRIAAARVRGFQGDDLRDDQSLLACPKHFAAYGAVQGGMEYNTADIPETTLREVYLPPFRAAFAAGALSTMSSFNDIAGVPSTGNRHLLTGILRDEWGFTGLVVSDYTSEEEMIAHGFAADGPDAVVKALTAGCDIAMQSGLYAKHIPALVRSGRLPVAVVDRAVRRVLSVKKALGLFENPYRSLAPSRAARDVRRPEAVALAREAGRKAIVLLKNEGGLLPLPKRGRSIALIGPFVSDREDIVGPWAPFPDIASGVTLEEGVRRALGDGAQVTATPGCGVDAPLPGGVAAAVAAARAADVVVLHLGESKNMSGEAQARTDIGIPPAQLELAEAIGALGKPVVVVLQHGRALALSGAVARAPAILCSWFLGSESGHALADILFGDHAPQGRLPVSFPQVSGQEPYYYNHRSTGRPEGAQPEPYKARYREVSNRALYPFGHGLGYSSVAYGPTEVDTPRLPSNGRVKVRARVSNTGARMHHEVAQLYIHQRTASITQPIRVLRGVQHLDLPPGGSAIAEFELAADDLAFVHADLTRRPEPSDFDVWVAPSAEAGIPARFTLAR